LRRVAKVQLLVVQEMRIGVFRLDRIEESKMYRVIDDRKNGSENFSVGGCSLFVETEYGKLNANNPRVIADSHW